MKVLLDTCVWGGVRQSLSAAGYDVIWAGDWKEDPGDDEILALAYRERRVLVTLDKDFGTLAFLHGRPHAGILRLVNLSTQQQISVCLTVLFRHGATLQAGAIVTAESNRIRIRQPGGLRGL
ncbi:MAG: toxin-antitoxin system, toxin component, PIN family protein [Anaerolineae bacterium CG2_30_64_16]|nr:MAG: toxin-antitoxin system, toxin component, PIN family protein [Anaerolineae bacterium CG2_30_64_16]